MGEENSTWSVSRNSCDWSVIADGWHFEQIPAGQGACEADGHGETTWNESGVRGGMADEEVDVFEAETEPVSLRR